MRGGADRERAACSRLQSDGAEQDLDSSITGEIRLSIRNCEDVRESVPRHLLEMIQNRVLYAPPVSAALAAHIAKVERSARELAGRWYLDATALAFAARFHDAYRSMDGAEAIRILEKRGEIIDDFERASPILLHGRVAAVRIESNGYVPGAGENSDLFREVVNAVRYHTGGREVMSALEETLFIADRVGKLWTSSSAVPLDRALAMRNAYEYSLEILAKRGEAVHPRTLAGARRYGAE